MELNTLKEWHPELAKEIEKDYFMTLTELIQNARKRTRVYPNDRDMFRAFEFCSFENTRVVLIGQDPYHGPGQANGLSFSVNPGVALPPSLRNIFKELDLEGVNSQLVFGDLSPWAEQGVLLLNRVLSVEESHPNSHKDMGWERFTDKVIDLLSKEKQGLIFILWGSKSRSLKKKINHLENHYILESNHPSPLSANRGGWFGNNHFKKVNEILQGRKEVEIIW